MEAGATSDLPVTVAVAGACSISGTTVTLGRPPGVCAITADQAGDANYHPAPQATQTTTVIYDFTGFFRPVDNLPAVNGVKAGSAVPVKFSLNGNQTLAVLDGVPKTLPALLRAYQIQARASRVGFDWSRDQAGFDQVLNKVEEEIRELRSVGVPTRSNV